MFTLELWLGYTAACLLLVISPGPDNLLSISRGLSQGWRAALASATASASGILFHVASATFGLTLLIQASEVAFLLAKTAGAAYLLWLGFRAIRSRTLVTLSPAAQLPLRRIFIAGFLSSALNPKPGLFVLAFIPQFVSDERGSITAQMLAYGLWFALLTLVGFAVMGSCASRLSGWLRRRPGVVSGLNVGAGVAFIASGLSIAAMRR